MTKLKLLMPGLFFLLFGCNCALALVTVHPMSSPNGEHKVEILIGPFDQTSCRIFHNGEEVVSCWSLGFILDDGEPIPSHFIHREYYEEKLERNLPFPNRNNVISVSEIKEVRNSWKPLYGERNEIPDNYNECIVEYKDFMKIIFRAYDEGVAFCYEFETKENEPLKIKEELSSFRFNGDHNSWPVYSAQGIYQMVPLSAIMENCERPLLVQQLVGKSIAIGEARLVDFARMRLKPGIDMTPERPVLQAQLAGPVEIEGTGKPFRSPWRLIMAAERPGVLLERNYMYLNLNEPCKIVDTSWIKPGKVIRDGTLTTEGGKACVDFCTERGMQYLEFDAGWYGPENDDKSDARTVTFDPKRNPNPDSFDLPEIIKYADSKGIGVILYVNQKALGRQLDEILPLYEKWGIKGIKFGFVHVGTQESTKWLHEAVAKCAAHKLMVDIHDEYRVTGWERTYPNLMTVEGIRGNEEMPPAYHNVVTALTRMLCGRGDYTPCWYSNRIQTSRSHQLALPIVMYSPWTFLFWYDRPGMFKGEEELEVWKEMPTVWDETKVLIDDIPNTVAIARRSGKTWYLGILHGGEGLSCKISAKMFLSAEDAAKTFSTRIYTDKSEQLNDKNVVTEKREIDGNTEITLPLRTNGGAVVVFDEE